MIKTLFFIAALLVPGLAYAGTPSAPFSDQVVPAGPPSGTKCDYGPNYSGSIPAPAQAAGFTTCALNADFSNPFFSTISSWLGNCGGGTALWQFYWDVRFGTPGDCARVDMETDASIGKQVLHLQEQPGDVANNNLAFALDFPGWASATQHQIMFPPEQYFEITFRFTPASLTEGGAPAGPLDIYMNGWTNGCCGTENDYIEYTGGNPHWGGGQIVWAGNALYYAPLISISMDFSQYHTLGILVTSDGTTTNAKCAWVDGVPQGCDLVRPATVTGCDASCVSANFAQHGGIVAVWVGQGNANRGPNNVDMYITSERVFTCAGYKSASTYCFGAPVTSQ
jgi:hypothetical protein